MQRGGERTKGGREREEGREGEVREMGRISIGRKGGTVCRLLSNVAKSRQGDEREGGKD